MLFHESKTSKVTSLKDANFHPLANLFTICWKRNAETCSPLQSAIGACNSILCVLQKLSNVKIRRSWLSYLKIWHIKKECNSLVMCVSIFEEDLDWMHSTGSKSDIHKYAHIKPTNVPMRFRLSVTHVYCTWWTKCKRLKPTSQFHATLFHLHVHIIQPWIAFANDVTGLIKEIFQTCKDEGNPW